MKKNEFINTKQLPNVLDSLSASTPDSKKKEKLTREETLRIEALKIAASFLGDAVNKKSDLFRFADECLKYIKGGSDE